MRMQRLAWQASAPARIGLALGSAAWTHPVDTTACPARRFCVSIYGQSQFVLAVQAESECDSGSSGYVVDAKISHRAALLLQLRGPRRSFLSG